MMEYNRNFANMGTLSMTKMKDKVKKYIDSGKQIESGRTLYDLWVSASEEVYTELTMTPEYAKLHGELINSQMSVKKKWEAMIDQRLGTFNMPTRREVCTLQTRLQESRREVRTLKCEVASLKEQLTEEIEKLKKDLLASNSNSKSTSSSTATTSTAPSSSTKAVKKKRTVTKKAATKKAAPKKD